MEIFEVEGEGCHEFFKNWSDIEKTLKISYSSCTSVIVKKSPNIVGATFTVTGFLPLDYLDDEDKPFEHIYKVIRHSLIEGPTHL